MSCNPKCKPADYTNLQGDLLMVAQPGNSHYKAGTVHKECLSCARPRIAASIREMATQELITLNRAGELTSLSARELADLEQRLTWGLDKS